MECRNQAESKDGHCWTATEVNMKTGVKEETMKKLIYITTAFMLMSMFIGCSAMMTPEQHNSTYDLRESMGNQAFVGENAGIAHDDLGLF